MKEIIFDYLFKGEWVKVQDFFNGSIDEYKALNKLNDKNSRNFIVK